MKKTKYGQVVCTVILCILAAILLFPIVWMFLMALKPGKSVITMPPDLSLVGLTLENFIKVFKNEQTVRWILNSILVSVSVMGCSVLTAAMAGYAFAKKQFPGKRILFSMMIVIMSLSTQVIMVPLFMEINSMGLYDSYWALILPFAASPFYSFLACQFMQGLHDELFNAARLDGCSEWKIFTKIVLPLAKPVLGVISIFSFITAWTDLLWPLIATATKEHRTLAVGLTTIQQFTNKDYGYMMAGSAVATIPIVIIFIAFQKYFVGGIALGGVKE